MNQFTFRQFFGKPWRNFRFSPFFIFQFQVLQGERGTVEGLSNVQHWYYHRKHKFVGTDATISDVTLAEKLTVLVYRLILRK